MWLVITSKVNAYGYASGQRHLSLGAQQKFTNVQRERSHTAGGPPSQPSKAEENTINCMRDTGETKRGVTKKGVSQDESQSMECGFHYRSEEFESSNMPYLIDTENLEEYGKEDIMGTWTAQVASDYPIQDDGTSCGVFCLKVHIFCCDKINCTYNSEDTISSSQGKLAKQNMQRVKSVMTAH
ncbi:Hypothetical predicted protein, partial [Mytilus galloprovincialis]